MINISDFLKNIQEKPEKTKAKIFWASGGVTVILVLTIWSASIESYRTDFSRIFGDTAEGLKATLNEAQKEEPLNFDYFKNTDNENGSAQNNSAEESIEQESAKEVEKVENIAKPEKTEENKKAEGVEEKNEIESVKEIKKVEQPKNVSNLLLPTE
ncbi:MAG: hypothetical protein V1698_00075 [bacterium]